MSLNEIEQVKNKLVEKELYFKDGSLKKESVVIVPKMTAVDRSIILDKHKIAVLKDEVFENVLHVLCEEFGCLYGA